jgi:hypothetical protein
MLSMDDQPNAQEIISKAINRTLGIPPPKYANPVEYPEEPAIVNALSDMLRTLQRKIMQPSQQPSAGAVQHLPSVQSPQEAITQTTIQQQTQAQAPPQLPTAEQQAQIKDLLHKLGSRPCALARPAMVKEEPDYAGNANAIQAQPQANGTSIPAAIAEPVKMANGVTPDAAPVPEMGRKRRRSPNTAAATDADDDGEEVADQPLPKRVAA